MKKRPSLDAVLAYQNSRVITSFLKTFAVSQDEAIDIFEQVKCMFWLINEMGYDGHNDDGKLFNIDNSLLVMDEMWHAFVLFTKDYHAFCIDTFGQFIHHYPVTETDAEIAARKAHFDKLSDAEATAEIMNEKRWQYTYVFKKLGKERFLKWYTEFHEKYPARQLIELRLRKINANIQDNAPIDSPAR